MIAVFALLGVLCLPWSAWAHANLRGTDPPQGARLAAPPASIRLWFDEAVVPEVSSLRVLDRSGKTVKKGPLKLTDADRKAAAFALGKMDPGAYTAAWKVLSAVDGHVTRGAVSFAFVPPGWEASVGAVTAPGADGLAQPWSTWVLRGLNMLAVWAHLLSLVAVTGILFVWPRLARGPAAAPPTAARFPPALLRLLFRGTLVAIAAGVVSLQLEWLQVSDAPWAQTFQVLVFFPAIPVALGTWSSIATFTRLALLTGVASLLTRPPEDDLIAFRGTLILAGSSLASVAVASHAAAAAGFWWALSDFVHLTSASVWIGGLVLLARIALWPGGGAEGELGAIPLRDAMRRFTPWAATSAALLLLTGLANTAAQVPRLGALWRTPYGGTLTAKISLVLPMLGLAFLNTLWCRGAFPPGERSGGSPAHPLRRIWARGEDRFRRADWAIRGELGLGVVVLLCAAALTQLPPPKDSAFAPPPPLAFTVRADGLRLAVTLTAPQGPLGPSRIALTVLDEEGQPPPPDSRVILRPEMLEREVRVLPVLAAPQGGGQYEADLFFGLLGRWDLEVTVRRKGREDAAGRFALELGDLGFTQVDPSAKGATRLSLAAAWAGRSARRQLLIGAGLALGACCLMGFGAWYRRWAEVALAAVLLVVGGFYLWSAMVVDTTPATLRQNPIPRDAKSLEAGRALYQENCATCHGARGKPGPLELGATFMLYAVTLDLTADHMAQHTDGDLFWWIARGIPSTPMPAFGASLSEEERWHLVNYIRSLRSGPSARP